MVKRIYKFIRQTQTRRALNAMTDRQLADIGINRYDIDEIARKA